MSTKDILESLAIAGTNSPGFRKQCDAFRSGGMKHFEVTAAHLVEGNGMSEAQQAREATHRLSEVCTELGIPAEAVQEQICSIQLPYGTALRDLLHAHPDLSEQRRTEAKTYAKLHAICYARTCAICECLASGNGDAGEQEQPEPEPQRKAKSRRATENPGGQAPAMGGIDLNILGIKLPPPGTKVKSRKKQTANPWKAMASGLGSAIRHPLATLKSMFGGSGNAKKRR